MVIGGRNFKIKVTDNNTVLMVMTEMRNRKFVSLKILRKRIAEKVLGMPSYKIVRTYLFQKKYKMSLLSDLYGFVEVRVQLLVIFLIGPVGRCVCVLRFWF